MIARYVVTRESFEQGGFDGLGNSTQGYGPPEPVRVFGWFQPTIATSSTEPARDDVANRLTLMLPAGSKGNNKDRWTVDGIGWLQVGPIQDYSCGNPFGFQRAAQAIINLVRVEG